MRQENVFRCTEYYSKRVDLPWMMPIRVAKENQRQRTTREDALIGRADSSSIAYHRKCLLSTYGCHRVDRR